MRLLLGLPTAGQPTKPFLESLAGLHLPANCTALERSVVSGNFIPAQRELLAQDAVRGNFDVLVMIDDDMIVPQDALVLLCAALEEDPQTAMVGAVYYSRDGLRPMAVIGWRGDDTTGAVVPPFDDRTANAVDGVGFGCAAIRVEAIRALEEPYFSAHIFIERKLRRVRVTDEDYLFCERLRKSGKIVRLHGGVRCGHYDRASGKVIPEYWEPPSKTARPRMYVMTPKGQDLVDADYSLPRGSEHHRVVKFDYLTVE